MRDLCAVLLVGVLLGALPAAGQPTKGIVWHPPADIDSAATALIEMEAMGVRAVRTPVITDDRLFVLADTLRMQIYQDLPITALSARQLQDTLRFAQAELAMVLEASRFHASARHVGVVINSDTAHPEACEVIAALAAQVQRDGPPGMRAYYVTPFRAGDRCLGAADLVLIDAFDVASPLDQLNDIRERAPEGTRVGLGTVGTWVASEADGLDQPHSEAWQARYLEARLPELLASEAVVVFIDRWQDHKWEGTSWRSPLHRGSGLSDGAGQPRLSLEVVRGFFSQRQRVFAFRAGQPPSVAFPWQVVAVWGLVATLLFTYVRAPSLQQMAPRYFAGRSFYRDAILRGRDLPIAATIVLFVTQALAVGAAGSVVLRLLRDHMAFAVFVQWMPALMQRAIWASVYNEVLLALGIAAVYAGIQLWWALLLAMLARRVRPMSIGQMLILIAWPQWPLWIAAGVLLVWPSSEVATLEWIEALSAGGILIVLIVLGSFRTLRDYTAMIQPAGGSLLMVSLFYPVFFILLVVAMLVARHLPELAFLGRLIGSG